MQYYSIKEILNERVKSDTLIKVRGWVRTRRDSKAGISFIALSDGSSIHTLQLVVPNSLPNYQSEILSLTTGCSIEAEGDLIASQGKDQAYELAVKSLRVIGWVENPDQYPMSAKRHTMEHLREYSHLRPRTNIISAVSRIRHHTAWAIHQFFHERGFFWVHTPIITSCDCEGAGEMFTVSTLDLLNIPRTSENKIDFSQDFFGQRTYLTVSGQLNVEAYCLALSKVYTFGPTFRAENSNTTRHLAEFWMIEPEVAFADLNDNATLAQDFIQHLTRSVLQNARSDMEFFAQWVDKDCIKRLENMLANNFERLNYTDAIEILKKSQKNFEYAVDWGVDLQTEHERFLTDEYFKKPVIVMM